MATQPVGEANQQHWDDVLTQLVGLSSSTVRRNQSLENRVGELEVELSVWKQAHSVALEASEREVKAHNVQLASLNRQISNLDGFKKNHDALILCIINGDEFVFNREYLLQGYQGGRLAAQKLTQAIAGQLSSEDVQVYGKLSFWITIYFNKAELAEDLCGNDICTAEQFQAFLAGFTQSSPRFTIADVGGSKEALENKIKGVLTPHDSLIIIGGAKLFVFSSEVGLELFEAAQFSPFIAGYDAVTYMSTLSALEKDQMLGKIVVLQTSQAQDLNNDRPNVFSLPRLVVEGIFMTEKLARTPKKLAPLTTGPYSAVTSNGGLISPQSPARPVGRPIDPSLPLHKQNPPPCNEFYLMTCSKGAGVCKYSHEYNLTNDQLVSLANNAKKAPCNWLKNGVQCPYGDQCCWGHVCPNGPKCFHLSKGKCWFKGEAMHPEPSTSTN